ncbi:uncharacterized protein LOC123446933 [Hordeum vulgare subsp. vulgare]|uniref:uncharacterized protein LOC123446933 n=1 Tax=Hordeum vulgare subsp. vulgare TaxID=112509 RepID=UPI001D1A3AD9|nr:uncharacterized protein LOC123446933 [Hordeum vulgare subsp. vulgare]
MDYSLAALKLFASQLAGSTTAPSSEGSFPTQMLFGIRFQRAWIQGVVVHADYSVGDGRLFVDDGSCVTELMLRPEDAKGQPWCPGMWILSLAYIPGNSENLPVIK